MEPDTSISDRISLVNEFAACDTAVIVTKRSAGSNRSNRLMEEKQQFTKITKPTRIDLALVDRGLCVSREKAKRAVMAGQVLINSQKALKASDTVKPNDNLTLVASDKYVSRGGHKLDHALDIFKMCVKGLNAIDLGASTGGFTDCLLQRGAVSVTAVDVGKGQLAWKLRNDLRVTVMERTNARHLTPLSFSKPFKPFELGVIDCSFISLRQILPAAVDLLQTEGQLIALLKPQFEAGKAEVDKGQGVIRDPAIHKRVLDELRLFINDESPLRWLAETESPLIGPAGNKEFLVQLKK